LCETVGILRSGSNCGDAVRVRFAGSLGPAVCGRAGRGTTMPDTVRGKPMRRNSCSAESCPSEALNKDAQDCSAVASAFEPVGTVRIVAWSMVAPGATSARRMGGKAAGGKAAGGTPTGARPTGTAVDGTFMGKGAAGMPVL